MEILHLPLDVARFERALVDPSSFSARTRSRSSACFLARLLGRERLAELQHSGLLLRDLVRKLAQAMVEPGRDLPLDLGEHAAGLLLGPATTP